MYKIINCLYMIRLSCNFKIDHVIGRLQVSRVTAAKYLKELEKIGILQSRRVWKETLYINTQLFDLLKK